jgi:hypothetical protein
MSFKHKKIAVIPQKFYVLAQIWRSLVKSRRTDGQPLSDLIINKGMVKLKNPFASMPRQVSGTPCQIFKKKNSKFSRNDLDIFFDF